MLQFALPIFLGAFLLFQIQPIIARCILPWFGGTPAVWTTCMLFFQVLLLGGYAYAHWVVTRLRPRGQAVAQGVLVTLSLALMGLLAWRWGVPIIPDSSWKPPTPDFPIPRIIALLTVAVGLPYFVLSTTSPLLQSWFARALPGKSPYRLYTLSNVGSLLALLSYPFLIEPALAMRAQAAVWSVGYVAFVVGYLVCVVVAAKTAGPAVEEATAAVDEGVPLTPRQKLLWIALPALASTLLLAVTNQMCQEIAVIPFLWIVPLSLYLLTFIICFDNPRWYSRSVYLPLLLASVPLLAAVMHRPDDLALKVQLPVYCGVLFICCMFCHGETVARKPRPRYLTSFYLAISIGGAVGGLFVALLAPLIFKRFYELHVALALCWALALVMLWRWQAVSAMVRQPAACALVAASLLLPVWSMTRPAAGNSRVLLSSRSFYGTFYVKDENAQDPALHRHKLVHGGTVHGLQYCAPDYRRVPVSYYTPTSGIGLALQYHPRRLAGLPLRIGVVGLGTGTLATYGRSGDALRYYEINPRVVAMAEDPRYFSFLSDCPARVSIALGDARLSLERELKEMGSQQFDVLALDAFSSDAIPAHLLTREALALYLQHLRKPDGILAIHTSNRSLNLQPIAFGLADSYVLQSALVIDPSKQRSAYASEWVLCTPSPTALQYPAIQKAAHSRPQWRQLRLWTDDYYNLYQILK